MHACATGPSLSVHPTTIMHALAYTTAMLNSYLLVHSMWLINHTERTQGLHVLLQGPASSVPCSC
jgi:hypothetical protein